MGNKKLPGDETWLTPYFLLHAEEQLPARREQRGRPAGGSQADEAEGAGDAALLQGDAGRRHRAQPALAGNALSRRPPHQAVECDCGSPARPSVAYAASHVPREQHGRRRRPLEGIPQEERHERAAGQTDDGQAEGGRGSGRTPRGQTQSPAAGEPGRTFITSHHLLSLGDASH